MEWSSVSVLRLLLSLSYGITLFTSPSPSLSPSSAAAGDMLVDGRSTHAEVSNTPYRLSLETPLNDLRDVMEQ